MNKRKSTGITLISLVITIIILIILAGVALILSIGENGIITKAIKSRDDTFRANAKEGIQIAIVTIQTEHEVEDVTLDIIENELQSKIVDAIISNLQKDSGKLEGTYTKNKKSIGFIIDAENFKVTLQGEITSENNPNIGQNSSGIIENSEGIYFDFYNNAHEYFTAEKGNVGTSMVGMYPISYPENTNVWNETSVYLDKKIELKDKFEVSMDIAFRTNSVSNMGYINIELQTKNNNNEDYSTVTQIFVSDAWIGYNQIECSISYKGSNIHNSGAVSRNNITGRIAIVGNNGNISAYIDNDKVGSIVDNETINIDRIKVTFSRYYYSGSYYEVAILGLRNLYIGNPKTYKTVI